MNAIERVHATHLLNFLALSEKIAAQCASKQIKLTADKKMRKFFSTQSLQEKQHALVFNAAVQWLQPKKLNHMPHNSLKQFEAKLNSALAQNRLRESIIAQQLLFEGLGEITLEKVSCGISDRGFGFQRIRKRILAQEHAHHRFGEKYLQQYLNANDTNIDQLTNDCKDYLEILRNLLNDMEPVLDYYNQTPVEFYSHLVNELPKAIRQHL